MLSEKNENPRPLAQISPTDSIDDPIIMHDHQCKVGDWTSLGRKRSLRKRDSQNPFGLTHSRLSPRPHDQGLRRGRGRPPKQRSDASSASQPLRRGPGRPGKKRSDESPTSQPLRRRPGRPRKQRSDAPTNAPAVSPPPMPPTGSNGNIPERVSMNTIAPELVLPPPMPPTGSNGNIPEQVSISKNAPDLVLPPPMPQTGSNGNIPEQVSMNTNAPELVLSPPVAPTGSNGDTPPRVSTSINASEPVPPPPVLPLGSTSDRPMLIPCYEDEEQRETKFKLNPLSRLKAAKETHTSTNGHSSQMHEKSQKVISDEVKSMLVSQLTSGTTNSVDDMVTFANRAFTMLNCIGADYGSLHKDVKDFITHKYDLFTEERKLDMLSVSELDRKYLDIVIGANDIEEEIEHIQVNQKMEKEEKEPLKRQVEDARELILRLEQKIADIEQREKFLKDDEQKYKAALKIKQAEVEILGTQMEAAREVQREIERRKKEALQGIEFTTRRLLSYNDKCMDDSVRRGRGHPRKQQRAVSEEESSPSQPLRRGPGRPRKNRSDAPTKAPAVPPPPVPPTGSNGNIPERVSMSTNAPELVPPTPVPPLGSTSARPFLIPNEDEEPRETKLKLTPLSRLMEEKETHASTNGSSSQKHEKSKKVFTDEVKSTLVSQLTYGTTTSVDDMVTFANHAFTTLNLFGADYGPLYKDVKDLIAYKYDLYSLLREN